MDIVKEEGSAAISKEQTHSLRLVLFINEQGSFALKERLVYEVFNHSIQNKKIELQSILSQPQFDELFSNQSCPHFGTISLDVQRIISATVFGLPSVPSKHDVLLKTHLEGEGLNMFLSGFSVQIRTKKVLSKKQLGCLYPLVHFNKLDITLLSFLLFEIFGIKPTSSSFTQLPQQHHIQIGDDILRLRLYRNAVSHGGVTGINQEEFDSLWKDISGALIRILGVEYKSRVDEMKSKCIDGPMLSTYRKLIDQWHQEDLETQRSLDEIRQAVIDFRKCVGHRDYQHRIWWKSQLMEVTKKIKETLLQSSKTLSETDTNREASGHLQNALLFANRADMLRACHLLDMNGIPFKTHTGSSLARSASSVGSGSSHRERPVDTQTKETRKKECSSKEYSTTRTSKSSKGRRRWTGPVLYKSDVMQTTEDSGTPTDVELLCKVMQHTPTSSLDELSFLTKNFEIHTPTSSLDAADLDAMEVCSVFSTVVDLPESLRDITRCRNGQPSRQHYRRSNTHDVSNASAPRTESINRESNIYKREQRLERRKLRKMEKGDIDEITEGDAHQRDLKDYRISRPDTPVPFYYVRENKVSKGHTHPPVTTPHFLESEESQDFRDRQQNKRWTTHPTRHSMRTNGTNKNRRRSASDVHPASFTSIQKRILDRYGGISTY
ncbi:hypothetical protein KP79_PYT07003 [Mizuhopecten yessoensis]|uniref:DZIP3-like HEPN domain-containing protein n=1 Tax=Mizuhopecten yessoensis TaxID=6573 RepID=A0A210QWR1_MIZYE|nr:hypothetical protein KP79_PYT07003 [Mizuhopecten yessoensis]